MTRRLVISACVVLAFAATLFILFMARLESRRTMVVPILMYHEIGKIADSPWCVPTETFRAQISALRNQGYRTILPSDIVAHRKWGKPLPRRPVILTFDDGYLSALKSAEPILKENGFRGIIYLITAQIAETPAERRQYEGKDCRVWPEAQAMQERGVFIFGGHSHDHANLAGIPNPAAQVTECKKQLRLHGIDKPYSFCYPHGQCNKNTEQAAREAGFQTAVVCEDAVAAIGPTNDLFALPRVSVMGGRHDFRLVSADLDAAKRALTCRILHSGIPLEISAGLGKKNNAICVWLCPREIREGEFNLLFSLPENTSGDALDRLEIWDKHRLFQLATFVNEGLPEEPRRPDSKRE